MAERRMFAKSIVLSDAFLDMPMSTRCLYFMLGMMADDDGFINNPKSVMRQCGASIDDINLLVAKKFIICFENGVVVIKHWKIHNYIQKDRYIPTKYEELKQMLSLDENKAYTIEKDVVPELINEPLSTARQKRQEAYRESELPYSFSYKIRHAFIGEKCPICGCEMGVPVRSADDPIITSTPSPTVQHNIPISKGGKHELSNISVVCSKCNSSIQDNITGNLNNALVVEKWQKIVDEENHVSGMYTQVRSDQVRVSKDISQVYQDSISNNSNLTNKPKSICDGLTDNQFDLLDNTYEDFLDLINFIDDKLKPSGAADIKDCYAYIISVARNERWATK